MRQRQGFVGVVVALGVVLAACSGPGASEAPGPSSALQFVVPTVSGVQTPDPTPRPTKKPKRKKIRIHVPKVEDIYYANCTEAREAGAAPIYEGEPGYRDALDRDQDGVACET